MDFVNPVDLQRAFISLNFPPEFEDIPWEFQNCPNEFQDPKDRKYNNCGVPPNADPCEYLKNLHLAKEFRTYFLAIIPLVLSIIAILLNLAFAFVATLVLFKYGGSSKKRYTFLLSRSISTITAQILFYIVLMTWKTGGFEYSSATIFLLVGSLSFLTLTGTYLALSTLLYVAVVHPFWYREHITMFKCIVINVVIWIISITFSICFGIYGATLFYHDSAPITCEFENCQQPLAIFITVLLGVCYFTVLIVYVLMLLRMRNRNERILKENEEKNYEDTRNASVKRNIKAMNRLSFNLISFAFSKLTLLIVCIVALANLDNLATLGIGDKNPCKTFLNGKLYFQVELLASIAAIIWLIGMISDPIINAMSDPNMMRYLKNAYHRIKEKFKNEEPGEVGSSRPTDSNSSDS